GSKTILPRNHRGGQPTRSSLAASLPALRMPYPSPAARAIRRTPAPDHHGPDGSRDALTGRRETLDGDGCPHDRKRAQVALRMTYPQGGMLARGEGGPPWVQREAAA